MRSSSTMVSRHDALLPLATLGPCLERARERRAGRLPRVLVAPHDPEPRVQGLPGHGPEAGGEAVRLTGWHVLAGVLGVVLIGAAAFGMAMGWELPK